MRNPQNFYKTINDAGNFYKGLWVNSGGNEEQKVYIL